MWTTWWAIKLASDTPLANCNTSDFTVLVKRRAKVVIGGSFREAAWVHKCGKEEIGKDECRNDSLNDGDREMVFVKQFSAPVITEAQLVEHLISLLKYDADLRVDEEEYGGRKKYEPRECDRKKARPGSASGHGPGDRLRTTQVIVTDCEMEIQRHFA